MKSYAFSECEWCFGAGCNQCTVERKKYEAELQEKLDNPQPIFSAKTDNPHDMKLMKRFFGRNAVEHAFGEDGDGPLEMERNGCIASLIQLLHKDHPKPDEHGVEAEITDLSALSKEIQDLSKAE